MALYRPTALRQLLKELATRPKKGLSQNFLIDGNIVRKMAASASVTAGDLIVEIGPGPGALTECLLERGAHVVAIEMDATLAQALLQLPKGEGRLDVHCEDILQFPLKEELSRLLSGSDKKAKVVANLPYHLTSPILGLLLPMHDLISSVHVMVQEEVAQRLVGKAGTKNYSALTVFTHLYGKASYSFGVSRNSFMPVPKVDSAVVTIALSPPPEDIAIEPFLDFVHRAFRQRRKMMRGTLETLWHRSVVEEALETLHLPQTIRAETLTFEQLLAFYKLCMRKKTRDLDE